MVLEQGINQNKELAEQFFPAERAIAQQLGISRVTVFRALSVLEEKGLIVRQQGVGMRISQYLDY
ncbi:MAG: GntR family transcriptional regulator [Symbiopectobacterium sp.]